MAVLRAIPPLMTPLIIVGGIVGGLFTPTEASAIAVLYSLALGALIYKTVGLDRIPRVFYDSARFAGQKFVENSTVVDFHVAQPAAADQTDKRK